MRSRSRFFAQPVSIAAMPRPTTINARTTTATTALPIHADTDRRCRSRATSIRWYQQTRLALLAAPAVLGFSGAALFAVTAAQREQAIEVERLLQEGVGLETRRAALIERGEYDDRHRGDRRIGLLLAAKFPAVHDRHHQVEEDHLRLLGRVQVGERLAAVGGGRRLEPFERQQL